MSQISSAMRDCSFKKQRFSEFIYLNIDTPSHFLASGRADLTIGANCLWSPANTTRRPSGASAKACGRLTWLDTKNKMSSNGPGACKDRYENAAPVVVIAATCA